MDPQDAITEVQHIKGIGPFAAELIVLRGANAPDYVPANERRLTAEVAQLYGPDAVLDEIANAWKPFRTWRRCICGRGPKGAFRVMLCPDCGHNITLMRFRWCRHTRRRRPRPTSCRWQSLCCLL